jgi:hypothetical protein
MPAGDSLGAMPNPEPPATDAHPDRAAEGAEADSPAAPTIPSFDSLRAPRRRTAVDVLMPGSSPEQSAPAPARASVPRPAEYADLLRLGVHVARAVAGVPLRVAGWAVREPANCLRRLLGRQVG